MTVLPILERELRMRARSRGNYWARFIVAAAGVFVCAPPLVWFMPFTTPGQIGHGVFESVIGAAFLLCCAACLVTCDTISSERREGTLGLLLLTRVRHLDVLLAKFASSGLTSLLSLLALLPILVLPLLTGGVTGGEAAGKLFALFNTLFLALSVGLWASARGVERFRTGRAALLVVVTIILLPSLIGWILPGIYIEILSPLTAVMQAGAGALKKFPARYWLSIAVVQIFTWTLLARAAVRLRNFVTDYENEKRQRSLLAKQETLMIGGVRGFPSESLLASSQIGCAYCGRLNDAESLFCKECGFELHSWKIELPQSYAKLSSAPSALHWLLHRRQHVKPLLWVATALGFFSFAFYGMVGGLLIGGPSLLMSMSWIFSLVTTAIVGACFAWVSSRFFVEARRTGELELLLTTPLGAQQLVSTHWEILMQLIRLPLVLMLLPLGLQVLMLTLSFGNYSPGLWRPHFILSLVLNGLNTIFGTFAVCWVSVWFGLMINGQGRVVLWTVLLTKAVPFLFAIGWSFAWRTFFQPAAQPANLSGVFLFLTSFVPQLAMLLFFLWLIRLARSQLLRPSLSLEPQNPAEVILKILPRVAAAVLRARE